MQLVVWNASLPFHHPLPILFLQVNLPNLIERQTIKGILNPYEICKNCKSRIDDTYLSYHLHSEKD